MADWYGGAPDECSKCFGEGEIVKLVNGECPKCARNPDGYKFCHSCNDTHHVSYKYCKEKTKS